MIRGLYTAASGMMAKEAEVNVISNNMANADTKGYRKDETVTASFPKMLLSCIHRGNKLVGALGTGSVVDGIATSFEEGAIKHTGNTYDLALHGDAFFAVRDGGGRTFYTRNGGFILDQNMKLVTAKGDGVLGEIGGEILEIYVPGKELKVDEKGNLEGAVDIRGREISRLHLRSGASDWEKVGDTLFRGTARAPGDFLVEQGAVEGSNVNSMEEMVKLIAAMRAYEANSKVIQTIDNSLDRLINTVGSA